MPDRRALFALAAGAFAAACAHAAPEPEFSSDADAIRRLIAEMEAAWNRGDFEGYMAGFANPDVVFVSRGRMRGGWQDTLDHYVRDYGGAPERRGALRFEIVSIERLGPDAAMLISHYRLERPQNAQQGVNTRLMRKRGGRWLIAMNHVSSYDPHASAS